MVRGSSAWLRRNRGIPSQQKVSGCWGIEDQAVMEERVQERSGAGGAQVWLSWFPCPGWGLFWGLGHGRLFLLGLAACWVGAPSPQPLTPSVPFPAVTTTSPMKTLYVMSDAKLSALTKSVMGEATSGPLRLPGIQPSSSSASSPPGTIAFASAPSPPSSLLHSKVGPVLQTASKTVILTSTLAALKGDGPLGHLGDKVSLTKSSAAALGHALGTAETLGRVPSVVDDGSTVTHGREALASRHVLPGGAGPTLIALGSGSSVIATAGPTLSQKP